MKIQQLKFRLIYYRVILVLLLLAGCISLPIMLSVTGKSSMGHFIFAFSPMKVLLSIVFLILSTFIIWEEVARKWLAIKIVDENIIEISNFFTTKMVVRGAHSIEIKRLFTRSSTDNEIMIVRFENITFKISQFYVKDYLVLKAYLIENNFLAKEDTNG
ncbi:hypothetical protein PBAL39_15364 [Pedobacter sp. BAL39]|uniref:hypothetical protein n=1 Tax=Pedobacter sp. BAL39 TaxID=391596 RepID=UPI0001559CB9|nr:hypothetical protein [Pedobacter sp. BAL39]EDM37816.1 hypothetical protein PBAL39_15364 [Pedobacter sp. BAL39]